MSKKILIIFISTIVLLIASCGDSGKDDKENPDLPAAVTSMPSEGSKNSGTKESVATDLPSVTQGVVRSIRVRNLGPLGQVFNDSNYVQLAAAQQMGIEPITGLDKAYFTKRPIVKVESNQYYQIDSLKHSIPYLVPEAAALLEDIGRSFNDSLSRRGGDSYRIKVTSLLRTPESVGRLRRVNVNATDSSTHQYATTFDISYTNFYCLDENRQINQGDLKNLLGEVLYDMRQQGRCHVKFERKTGCFHVTVAK